MFSFTIVLNLFHNLSFFLVACAFLMLISFLFSICVYLRIEIILWKFQNSQKIISRNPEFWDGKKIMVKRFQILLTQLCLSFPQLLSFSFSLFWGCGNRSNKNSFHNPSLFSWAPGFLSLSIFGSGALRINIFLSLIHPRPIGKKRRKQESLVGRGHTNIISSNSYCKEKKRERKSCWKRETS